MMVQSLLFKTTVFSVRKDITVLHREAPRLHVIPDQFIS